MVRMGYRLYREIPGIVRPGRELSTASNEVADLFLQISLSLLLPPVSLPSISSRLSSSMSAELAFTYAALILADEGVEITVSFPSPPCLNQRRKQLNKRVLHRPRSSPLSPTPPRSRLSLSGLPSSPRPSRVRTSRISSRTFLPPSYLRANNELTRARSISCPSFVSQPPTSHFCRTSGTFEHIATLELVELPLPLPVEPPLLVEPPKRLLSKTSRRKKKKVTTTVRTHSFLILASFSALWS